MTHQSPFSLSHGVPKLTSDQAPWLFQPATQAVFAALSVDGARVRVVGGAVRNALLGRAVNDVDLATDAVPEATMQAAAEAGLKVIATGLQHGTVTVVSGGIGYEVTTLRRDVETDGRHAVVAFTDDWTADAARRDFTINALYADRDGTLVDPLGTGLQDVAAGRVRFIGDAQARIGEDYLRILRFFRFSSAYATGPFDAVGLAAVARGADGLARVSAERIWSEIKTILLSRRAVEAVLAMMDSGVFVNLFGAVAQPQVFARRIGLEQRRALTAQPMQRLAALLAITVVDTERLMQRFKMSWDEHDMLRAVLATPPITKRMAVRTARARMFREGDGYSARVLHDWAMSGDRFDDGAWQALADLPKTMPVPAFPLTGRDLLAAGVPAGPRLGALLQALTGWWVDHDFPPDQVLRAELMARIESERT